MEELIRRAFLHVETLEPLVRDGRYELIGPNAEIILPQAWEDLVEPGWFVSMRMWPTPEPAPPIPPPLVMLWPPSQETHTGQGHSRHRTANTEHLRRGRPPHVPFPGSARGRPPPPPGDPSWWPPPLPHPPSGAPPSAPPSSSPGGASPQSQLQSQPQGSLPPTERPSLAELPAPHANSIDPKSKGKQPDKTDAQSPLSSDHNTTPKINLDEDLIKGYLFPTNPGEIPLLQPRRTLDQYFYTHLESTSQRDADQVVYRYTRGTSEAKMFMVDQLWLWILNEGRQALGLLVL